MFTLKHKSFSSPSKLILNYENVKVYEPNQNTSINFALKT